MRDMRRRARLLPTAAERITIVVAVLVVAVVVIELPIDCGRRRAAADVPNNCRSIYLQLPTEDSTVRRDSVFPEVYSIIAWPSVNAYLFL